MVLSASQNNQTLFLPRPSTNMLVLLICNVKIQMVPLAWAQTHPASGFSLARDHLASTSIKILSVYHHNAIYLANQPPTIFIIRFHEYTSLSLLSPTHQSYTHPTHRAAKQQDTSKARAVTVHELL